MHDLTDGVVNSAALDEIVQKAISRRLYGGKPMPGALDIMDIDIIRQGKPTLLDIILRSDASFYHVVIGLMEAGDEPRFFPDSADQVLGLYDHDGKLYVAVDALEDQDMVSDLVKLIYTPQASPVGSASPASLVSKVSSSSSTPFAPQKTHPASPTYQEMAMESNMARKESDTDELAVYIVNESVIYTVIKEMVETRSPSIDFLLTLDSRGFNNMFPPLAVWERGDYVLGVVQEYMPGTSTGWDVALTSLRDLCSAGCAPEYAGADFAPDAFKIGEMLGRMHIALDDKSSSRRRMDIAVSLPPISSWPELDRLQAQLDRKLLEESDIHYYEIPVHGNFDLLHVRRGEYGWYLGDMMQVSSDRERLYASPLYDLAAALLSLHEVALYALEERDPLSADATEALVIEWEKRNTDMLINGYLNVSGIAGIVPIQENCLYAMLNMMTQDYRNRNSSS